MAPTIKNASAPLATESGRGNPAAHGTDPARRRRTAGTAGVPGDVVADRPAKHWITGLERVEDRALVAGPSTRSSTSPLTRARVADVLGPPPSPAPPRTRCLPLLPAPFLILQPPPPSPPLLRSPQSHFPLPHNPSKRHPRLTPVDLLPPSPTSPSTPPTFPPWTTRIMAMHRGVKVEQARAG